MLERAKCPLAPVVDDSVPLSQVAAPQCPDGTCSVSAAASLRTGNSGLENRLFSMHKFGLASAEQSTRLLFPLLSGEDSQGRAEGLERRLKAKLQIMVQ